MYQPTSYTVCPLPVAVECPLRVSQEKFAWTTRTEALTREQDRASRKALMARIAAKRAAFAEFEATIIDLYDRDELTPDLLNTVARRYSQREIDSSGSQSLLTCDGKDLWQVCIELIDPTFPLVMRGSSEDHDEYWEREQKHWDMIVRTCWHWKT
ncbi:MAG TPA: hypothetical protein VHD63_06065 [Ktedonobacteraceae bacterium]|nr:hypothetical protein [Ktedonobacteraceae bacterium]